MDGVIATCTKAEICSGEYDWEIDYESNHSLHNWYQKLDLYCEDKWKIGFITSAFFVGWTICLILFLPRTADIYGRRRVYLTSIACQFIGMNVILFTR